MIRRLERDPAGFGKVCRQRSLVKSVFSSIKERFGAVVAAKTRFPQGLQLILRSISHIESSPPLRRALDGSACQIRLTTIRVPSI